MQTLAEIRAMLAERGLTPRKRFGQNFLIDHNLIERLADAADVGPNTLALEIGPGTGALTESLLARGARVIACELDRGLADLIRDRFSEAIAEGRLMLVEGDCLAGKRALHPGIHEALAGRSFQLIANLPYGAGTPVITTLLADTPACTGLFVTIQREVADRLAAEPNTDAFGPVGVLAGLCAHVERLAVLPRECFWPRPDVTSAMVALRRDPTRDWAPGDLRRVVDFAQTLFSSRRKQLGASLKGRRDGAAGWPEGVQPTQRPAELTPAQIAALADVETR
ncbi:MAG: 16S rRNA (adenine(1518)-N(6)/adenine(1519)-N(6))-dimethyltransferase RsmA [Planctomycetota bacterium]